MRTPAPVLTRAPASVWRRVATLLGAGLLALPLSAAPQGEKLTEDEVKARFEKLEARNRELEARVDELEIQGIENDDALRTGLSVRYGDVGVKFQIFGDVGFTFENPRPDDDANTAFALGAVDFFVLAQLGDHFRVLSETVVEGDTDDDDTEISQERLWGAWEPNDAIEAKFGTEHSPISRWNQLYHHGRWLEMTTQRPVAVSFEGDMGILPLHRTGIELSGTVYSEGGLFNWFTTLSNGRGREPTQKQRSVDFSDAKGFDAGVAFEPFSIPGLRVGTAITIDRIAKDASNPDPDRSRGMDEIISSTSLECSPGPFDVLAEFFFIHHEGSVTNDDYDSNAGYVQVSYPLTEIGDGEWTPYTRFDFRNMRQGDPFYESDDRDLDVDMQTLGVRYDPNNNVALKFEVAYGHLEDRNGAGAIDHDNVVSAAFQLSWVL